jgi:hypothetical protein
LRKALLVVVEEEHRNRVRGVEESLSRFSDLLLAIGLVGSWDFLLWAEGVESKDVERVQDDLDMLEKAGLIKTEIKYRHRGPYRDCKLTETGAELLKKLTEERARTK